MTLEESNNDNNTDDDLGEKYTYDPSWKGPLHVSRSLTDRHWSLIFPLYAAGYCIISIYIIVNLSNFNNLTSFEDNKARYCGYNLAVRQKPYLLSHDLRRCLLYRDNTECRGICLQQCPSENFVFNSDTTKTESLSSVKKKLICTDDVELDSITSFEQLDALLDQRKCNKWYLKSKHGFGLCVPEDFWKNHENETITRFELSQIHEVTYGNRGFVINVVQQLFATLGDVMLPVTLGILFSAFISVLSLLLLRWIMVPLFALSVYALCTVISGIIVKVLLFILKVSKGYTSFIIGVILIQVIVLIIVFYCYEKILIGYQLVKVSNKAILQLPVTLVFPLCTCLLKLLILMLCLAVFLSLLTPKTEYYKVARSNRKFSEILPCADDELYLNGTFCDPTVLKDACKVKNSSEDNLPDVSCEYAGSAHPALLIIFHVLNTISCIWFLKYISALEHMIFSGAYAIWYWSIDKKSVNNEQLIEIATIVFSYHLGTVAAGTALIFLVNFAYIMTSLLVSIIALTKISKLFKEEHGKYITRLYSAETFLKKITQIFTDKAFIMSAIHGKPFHQSGKDAYYLLQRNMSKVTEITESLGWFLVITKIVVSGSAVGIVILYYYSQRSLYVFESTFYACIIVAGTISYLLGSVHFSLQQSAVDTVFLCFLEDLERNDGSSARPYHTNGELRGLIK